MAKVTFNSTQWTFAHGRTPRGTGCWAFMFDNTGSEFFTSSMSFTEAKRVVREEARRRGFTGTVFVLA